MPVKMADIVTTTPNTNRHSKNIISHVIYNPSSGFANKAEAKNRKNSPPIINIHFLNHELTKGLFLGSVFGLTIFPLTVTIILILFYAASDIMC